MNADGISLAARVVLAAVLGCAAIAKARSFGSVPSELIGFGVPEFWARPAAFLLVVTEVVVAMVLLVAQRSAWPGFLALGELSVFTGALIGAQLRGWSGACPCFGVSRADGMESAAPAKLIMRNAWLGALAIMATASAVAPEIATWLGAVTVLGVITVGVLRWTGPVVAGQAGTQ